MASAIKRTQGLYNKWLSCMYVFFECRGLWFVSSMDKKVLNNLCGWLRLECEYLNCETLSFREIVRVICLGYFLWVMKVFLLFTEVFFNVSITELLLLECIIVVVYEWAEIFDMVKPDFVEWCLNEFHNRNVNFEMMVADCLI